jgi:hypothetical protein
MMGQLKLNFPSGTAKVSRRKTPEMAKVNVNKIFLKQSKLSYN